MTMIITMTMTMQIMTMMVMVVLVGNGCDGGDGGDGANAGDDRSATGMSMMSFRRASQTETKLTGRPTIGAVMIRIGC